MPFTAWKHEERKKQTQRQKDVFSKISGGCVILAGFQ